MTAPTRTRISLDTNLSDTSPSPSILVVGAGAVGLTLGGWLQGAGNKVFYTDTNEAKARLQGKLIRLLSQSDLSGERKGPSPTPPASISPHFIDEESVVREGLAFDFIFFCVKNYHLASALQTWSPLFKDRAIAVCFQNGTLPQDLLPKAFARYGFGIVGFNIWPEEGSNELHFWTQQRGPLVMGSPLPQAQEAIAKLWYPLHEVVRIQWTSDMASAVWTKLIINLTNSVCTLVGFPLIPLDDPDRFQNLLVQTLAEGVDIVRAAGFQEIPMEGIPSWRLLKTVATLPLWLTRPLYRRKLRKMTVSSMTQDLLVYGRREHELESINGALVELARQINHPAPVNKKLLELCRHQFSSFPYRPLAASQLP